MAEDERADLACAAERLRPPVEQIDDSTESGIAIRKGKRFGERSFHAAVSSYTTTLSLKLAPVVERMLARPQLPGSSLQTSR